VNDLLLTVIFLLIFGWFAIPILIFLFILGFLRPRG